MVTVAVHEVIYSHLLPMGTVHFRGPLMMDQNNIHVVLKKNYHHTLLNCVKKTEKTTVSVHVV